MDTISTRVQQGISERICAILWMEKLRLREGNALAQGPLENRALEPVSGS